MVNHAQPLSQLIFLREGQPWYSRGGPRMGTLERQTKLERRAPNFSGPITFQNLRPSSEKVWKNAFVQVRFFLEIWKVSSKVGI